MTVNHPQPTPKGDRFRRKNHGAPYRVSGVPKRYIDQVQLSAVLRAAYGRLRTEADIIDATGWAWNHYHRRAVGLAEAGCVPFGGVPEDRSRLPNALACPVAFVLTYDKKSGRKPCGMPTICPFCWAREVRLQWQMIDAAFFPPEPRKGRTRVVDTDHKAAESVSVTHSVTDTERCVNSPYDLVRRVFTFHLPATYRVHLVTKDRITGVEGVGHAYVPAMTAWLESRLKGRPDPGLDRRPECRALCKAAGPGGGLIETIQFRRVGDDQAAAAWEVQVRQLILAVDGDKVPWAMHPGAGARPQHHIVIRHPSRRVVVAAVARMFRYPEGLIDPHVPAGVVAEYLNIRRGHRLTACYGRFRGPG